MSRDSLRWAHERGSLIADSARNFGGYDPAGDPLCPPPIGPPPAPPRGLDSGDAGLTRLIFPPRIEKLKLSTDFNVNYYRTVLPAIAGSKVSDPLLAMQLTSGNIGYLQSFGAYVLAPDQTTDIIWTLSVNGAPVQGFDNIRNFPGIVRLEVIPFDEMRIALPTGAKISVDITNVSGTGPWTVGAYFSGWSHPLSAEKRAWNLDI